MNHFSLSLRRLCLFLQSTSSAPPNAPPYDPPTIIPDYDPDAIANLWLWYRPDYGVATDSNARVTSWTDAKSNIVATAPAARPLAVSGARKGLPVIRFAKANSEYLEHNASGAYPLSGDDTPWTIFLVTRRALPLGTLNATALSFTHQADFYPASMHYSAYATANNGYFRRYDAANSVAITEAKTGEEAGDWQLFAYTFDAAVLVLRRGGVITKTATANLPPIVFNRLNIGVKHSSTAAPDGYWDGDIAEILVYLRALTDAERETVSLYLTKRFLCGFITPAPTYLVTPTYDGSGQALHPSVVVFDQPWNGYRYWMAMTPYPLMSDEYEDPSILVSSDGNTWMVPPGLTNPIDDGGVSPNHNADPELVYDNASGTLYCYWNHWTNATSTYRIYSLKTTDGIHWTSKTNHLTTSGYKLVTPTITHDGTYWRMYVIDITTSPNTMRYYTARTLDGPWFGPNDCEINGIASGRDPWHITIRRATDGRYYGLLTTCNRDASGNNARLALMSSTDGFTFQWHEEIFHPSESGWDNAYIYRATFGQTLEDVFYSAINAANQSHIGRTTLRWAIETTPDPDGAKNPATVPNLWAWWDATTGVTVDGNGRVAQWNDQSGNSRHLAQLLPTNRPYYEITNGRHNVRFDGSHYLDAGIIGPASGAAGRCIIAVVSDVVPTGNGYNHVVHYGSANTRQAYGLTTRAYTAQTGGYAGPGNHYWNDGMADAIPLNASLHVLTIYYDGSIDHLRIDGGEVVNKAVTLDTIISAPFYVGTRVVPDESFVGRLHELIVYSAVPSSLDIQGVERYLRLKWF